MTDDEVMAVFRAMDLDEEFIRRFELLRMSLTSDPLGATTTMTELPEAVRCTSCGVLISTSCPNCSRAWGS